MDFQVKLNETLPKEAPMCKELLQLGEGKVLEETVIAMVIGDHIKIGDPLTEEGIQMEVEDPLTGRSPGVGPPGEGYPNRNGRPPGRGGHPSGGPPDGGGGPPGPPGGQGPPGPQRPPGPVRPIIVQTPQVTLDMTALENTFHTVG